MKKFQRKELLKDEALFAARLLESAEIELLPMRFLLGAATGMSVELDHPAYDCLYLALAIENKCQFVTADERFLRKLHRSRKQKHRSRMISLVEAVKSQRDSSPNNRSLGVGRNEPKKRRPARIQT